MWNCFEFLNKSVKNEVKTKAKRLLIGWAIWSCIVLLFFVGFWFWHGMPTGPQGLTESWVMIIVISALAPPVAWLIGKAIIG